MKEETPDATIERPQATSKRKAGGAGFPASLKRAVSPPPFNPRRSLPHNRKSDSARVEAGEVEINDHVAFFSTKLLAAAQPPVERQPRLTHSDWLALYHRNLNDGGHHFVVHQHDHPIAGTHYDLRLQCNATSSISFALPYGLPGDPNSRRLNRFAIETRVHNLWNHLIETASYETGTMLLWDTGEYEVIPYDSSGKSSSTEYATATEDSGTDSDEDVPAKANTESEPQNLHHAFQRRKIKLRLHGTRLPSSYTISIRLLEGNDRVAQPAAPAFKRQRTNTTKGASSAKSRRTSRVEDSDPSSDSSESPSPAPADEINPATASPAPTSIASARTPSPTGQSFDSLDRALKKGKILSHSQAKRFLALTHSVSASTKALDFSYPIDPISTPTPASSPTNADSNLTPDHASISSTATSPCYRHPPRTSSSTAHPSNAIHLQNAYPGALNTISSIHQRKWFLSLDRQACGFRPTSDFAFGRRVWERPIKGQRAKGKNDERKDELGGFQPFHVLGRDIETSILTGRRAGRCGAG